MRRLVIVTLAATWVLGTSCSDDKNKVPAGAIGSDGVPIVNPASGSPAPARKKSARVAPSVARAVPAPAGLGCDQLAPKRMIDAITGLKTQITSVQEPMAAGKRAVRCEHRGTKLAEHFGFFVRCGKKASKTFSALRRRIRKTKTRKGPWRSGFESAGSFAFLSEKRGCFAQVVGRLLLSRSRIGERIASEIARNLTQ